MLLTVVVVVVSFMVMYFLGSFITKNKTTKETAEVVETTETTETVESLRSGLYIKDGYIASSIFSISNYLILLVIGLILYIDLYITKASALPEKIAWADGVVKMILGNAGLFICYLHYNSVDKKIIKKKEDEETFKKWKNSKMFLLPSKDELTFLTFIAAMVIGVFSFGYVGKNKETFFAIFSYIIYNVVIINFIKFNGDNLINKDSKKEFILFRVSPIVALFGCGFFGLFILAWIEVSTIILTAGTFGIIAGIIFFCIIEQYGKEKFEARVKEKFKEKLNNIKKIIVKFFKKVILKGKKQVALLSIVFIMTIYCLIN